MTGPAQAWLRSQAGAYFCWIALFGDKLHRRHLRQNDLNPCALAGFGMQIDPPPQAVGHDAVDDMKAETGAALIAAGGEKRVEGPTPDVRAHAAFIVGEQNLDVIVAGLLRLDLHRTLDATQRQARRMTDFLPDLSSCPA